MLAILQAADRPPKFAGSGCKDANAVALQQVSELLFDREVLFSRTGTGPRRATSTISAVFVWATGSSNHAARLHELFGRRLIARLFDDVPTRDLDGRHVSTETSFIRKLHAPNQSRIAAARSWLTMTSSSADGFNSNSSFPLP
jgi:hypothetical protein